MSAMYCYLGGGIFDLGFLTIAGVHREAQPTSALSATSLEVWQVDFEALTVIQGPPNPLSGQEDVQLLPLLEQQGTVTWIHSQTSQSTDTVCYKQKLSHHSG